MPKDAASGPTPVDVGDAPTYPADLTIALQAELAALADIEADYATKRHGLENWAGSPKIKERIVREVEVRHKRDRQPHGRQRQCDDGWLGGRDDHSRRSG